MRILIISYEVWRNDTNGGNVLTNIFSGINAEFAQIYCTPGLPQNDLCKKYYQITDSMIIKNVFKRNETGEELYFSKYPLQEETKSEVSSVPKWYKKAKRLRLNIFYVIEEIMWRIADVHNQSLKKFINDFAPDIIFAPCYGKHMMLRLNRFVAEYTEKPMISYISDDNYSLRQAHVSPVYWINRFMLRHDLRKTFRYYDLVYTMTEEQKNECEKAFNANMKILRKSMNCKNNIRKKINKPIKIIFAGGIYCGRWKTLKQIVKAIKLINAERHQIEMHIYTQNDLNKNLSKILNDKKNSYVHPPVSIEELWEKYDESDIALHVESFDMKNRLKTRLSFSTKIVDCLASGCAVMAVAWRKHAGLTYLKREDAAICIDNVNDIYSAFLKLCNNHEILYKCKRSARECLHKNHNVEVAHNMVLNDFKELINENSTN